MNSIAYTLFFPQAAQLCGNFFRFCAYGRLIRSCFPAVRIKPCAPVHKDVHFVCKRVLEHGDIFPGLQTVITQEIILLFITLQLFQFFQHLAAHPAGRLTFFNFAQHIQVTPIQRTEAVQLLPLLRGGSMRPRVIFFAPVKLLPLRVDPFNVLADTAALRFDPCCKLAGRVFFTQ